MCRTPRPCSSRSCSRRGCRPKSSSSCTARARRAGKALVEHPRVPVISFTGSTETGQHRRRDLRAHAQAPVARDGREERHDRARRRGSRTRARRRAVGRVRDHRPALHRDEPPAASGRRARRVPEPARGAGPEAEVGRRTREGDGRRPADQRCIAEEGGAVRRHRRRGRRGSPDRRAPSEWQGPREGLLLRADDFRARRSGDAHRAGGDLRSGAVRDSGRTAPTRHSRSTTT